MQVIKVPYKEIPQFSSRDKAYIEEVPTLRPFYKYPVDLESFRQVIEDKRKEKTNRKVLVEVLREQHQNLNCPEIVNQNIESLLDENTFTIVTAHQPSLFTGPLYYILKIISTINLAEKLAARYPDFRFVPVFISSGEDHDFEEVNHLHLFNQTLTWESGQTGSVGQMQTETLQPVLSSLKELLGESERAREIYSQIESIYTRHTIYGNAAFEMAQTLFQEDGLVVLNTNHPELKRLLIPVIREEVLRQSSHPIVEETIRQLSLAGFSSQATPREINFFYLKDQIRERIIAENNGYTVLNTNIRFTIPEMETEIELHPERFSPNVIIRPIYQETILPNLAYVGGGGEIAYWLERKKQFEFFGLNFPMLVRRDSVMWIDTGTRKKIEKTGIQIQDLWLDTHTLIKQFIEKQSATGFSLESEKMTFELLFQGIAEKANAIDPTLSGFVMAEHAKAKKSLEQIETRFLRAEKQKHDQGIAQIQSIKDRLFPGGGLQERYDNFLPFYLKLGKDFFRILRQNLDPLDKEFKIFLET